MQPPTVLRAPGLVVDAADHRARLNERTVELGPKPFALLLALMRAAPRLVTKDELIETVWEGRFVTEAVVTTAMRELRRALGDDARNPRFIGTAHGRGYRFLLEVTQDGATTAPAAPRRLVPELSRPPGGALPVPLVMAFMFLAAIGVLAALTSALNRVPPAPRLATVAVLPFQDLSPAAQRSYLAEGLSDDLITALSAVEGLSVSSRTASFAFRGADAVPAPEAARRLGVRHVLAGSVLVAGESMRVQVQLQDTQGAGPPWSRAYERAFTVEDMFAVQGEITRDVAAELRSQLRIPIGAPADLAALGTADLQAYDQYLRARELFIARSDLARSVALARAAVTADPNFARAWELLAAASFANEGGRVTPAARDAAATALRLDPELSLAYAIRGVMNNIDPPYDWDAAIGDLEQALRNDPRNTTALLWLGTEMHKLGYLERSQALLERCLALDPAYDRCREHLVWVLHMREDDDRAIAEYRRLVREGARIDDLNLLQAFLRRGAEQDARAVAASITAEQPMPAILFDAMRPDATIDRAAAVRALRDWTARVRYRRDIYPLILELGAYDLLLVEQGSTFGFWLPEFPEFRRSGAFKHMVRAMGVDTYWRAHGFPPQCRAAGPSDFICT